MQKRKENNVEKNLLKQNENRSRAVSVLWGVFWIFVMVIIDQLTKLVADAYLKEKVIDIIPGWISLRLTYNQGIAYGQLSDVDVWVKMLIIAATGVLMLVFAIVYMRLDVRRSLLRAALVMVVAGGIGNLIDRVYFQVWDPNALYGVRDMVDLSRFGFAVCNFADFFICIGAALLVLSILFFDKDALFPVGKYKALALEYELAEQKEQEADERLETY